MNNIVLFAALLFIVQTAHSVEELATGFHKKWYLFKMPFKTFIAFEIAFESFWLIILLSPNFPFRLQLLAFFIALMFANGVQHIVWAGFAKKYVPGLLTAPFLILLFLIFYFKSVFSIPF